MSKLLTVNEVCARLGLKKSAVYELIGTGLIGSSKVGPRNAKYVVTESELEAYLERTRTKPRPPRGRRGHPGV